jgi:hypothetical protein
MKRRRLLASVGALAGGGSLALGTGAFTSVSAERSVSVAVAKDYRAFLRLEPIGDEGIDGETTGRSFINGERAEFEIPGDDDGENPSAEGVAPDSVYQFHDLLHISNRGTQPIKVYSQYGGSNLNELSLVTDNGRLSQTQPTLDVGEGIDVGLYIDTHGTETDSYDETLTIVAERVGGNRD